MAQWLHDLHHGTRTRQGLNSLQSLARLALAQGGTTLSDQNAATRYSDRDTVELLVLRSLRVDADQRLTRLTLLNGEVLELPHDRHRLDRVAWRRLSATLMAQVVTIAASQQPIATPREHLRKLGFQHVFYLGSPEWDDAVLRVALRERNGNLTALDGGPAHTTDRLEYRPDLGYRLISHKDSR